MGSGRHGQDQVGWQRLAGSADSPRDSGAVVVATCISSGLARLSTAGSQPFVAAVGIDIVGEIRAFGFWEGAKENHEVCKEVLADNER